MRYDAAGWSRPLYHTTHKILNEGDRIIYLVVTKYKKKCKATIKDSEMKEIVSNEFSMDDTNAVSKAKAWCERKGDNIIKNIAKT